jgi:large repetitive protein
VFLTTTLPDATFGAPYGPQILVTGGIYPYTAWYTGGGLAGFSFDLNGSLVSSQVYQFPGTYQLPVIITDSSVSGQRLSYTFTITIKPGIELSPNLLTGAVFQHYSDTIYVVSGGSAPYTFAVASGTLPPGLQLDGTTGALSGTPTIPGTYLFRIAVADSTGLTGAQDYSLDISGLTAVQISGLTAGRRRACRCR